MLFSIALIPGTMNLGSFLRIHTSIVLGITAGILCGWLLSLFFQRIPVSIAKKTMLFFITTFLLYSAEDLFKGNVGFSSLIAVIASGMVYAAKLPDRQRKHDPDDSCSIHSLHGTARCFPH